MPFQLMCVGIMNQQPTLSCSCSAKTLIKTALKNNDFLKNLDQSQVHEIVNCMYEETYAPGELIIQQDAPGNHFYVSAGL